MGEVLRPLRVTLLIYETAAATTTTTTTPSETLHLDIEVSETPSVAEIKAILETSDWIPSPSSSSSSSSSDEPPAGDASEAKPAADLAVYVRCEAGGAVMTDDDILPKSQSNVQVLVLPKGVGIPGGVRRTFATAPYNLEDIAGPTPLSSVPLWPSSSDNMQQMLMQSPLVRSMLEDPELLRALLEANPELRQLRERNPELNLLFNDPDLFRQSVAAMQNPALLREMVSNSDRALSNIDVLPGGFNALRRVYNEIQSPLWEATTAGMAGRGGEQPSSAAYGLDISPFPRTAPIPNPFAPHRNNSEHQQQQRTAGNARAASAEKKR